MLFNSLGKLGDNAVESVTAARGIHRGVGGPRAIIKWGYLSVYHHGLEHSARLLSHLLSLILGLIPHSLAYLEVIPTKGLTTH